MALGVAAALALSSTSNVLAGERPATKFSSKPNVSYSTAAAAHASVRQGGASFGRKCVTMSCGAVWCYNARGELLPH
jgi:hypothetical protein